MRKRATARDSWTRWPHESSAWMDYLHGDVVDGEYEAACFYEYARESTVLREVATRRGRWEELAQNDQLHLIMQYPWFLIWNCASFPSPRRGPIVA
jgi:hypothetical protein